MEVTREEKIMLTINRLIRQRNRLVAFAVLHVPWCILKEQIRHIRVIRQELDNIFKE